MSGLTTTNPSGLATCEAIFARCLVRATPIEIVLHVALNTWTNYINEVAKTDIDFPVVTSRKAA